MRFSFLQPKLGCRGFLYKELIYPDCTPGTVVKSCSNTDVYAVCLQGDKIPEVMQNHPSCKAQSSVITLLEREVVEFHPNTFPN